MFLFLISHKGFVYVIFNKQQSTKEQDLGWDTFKNVFNEGDDLLELL